ncbi:relaxase/mobilization nuclease [Lacrimispora amygdalina]|uniref:Relaxase/mobilization nuclease n=1 Tax=Lacrimispora amygdalina TaxID=253257 RepID=A0A3E2NCD5_9FIRM|nr:relaxase/mobilization nuclease domain-containing protein [Clostridium indicum]RFZ78551.1 relaxase/mobilization nuclease [Clostridium indicum]
MAITKIMHMNSEKNRNPAQHLQNALEYIQNPDKTEKLFLVGSVNCLPETAFEQMMDTKKLFQKTNKRQGYHIVLSLKPGEGTPEIAFDMARRFTEEFLGDRYEAVYAVHIDKDHIHSHIVWNSVSLLDGRKYDYKKGDWKHIIQPITNKLCKEYGLSIVEAEYVKNSQNLSRKEWQYEQTFKEMIHRDAMFCASYAGSMEHFLFLMQRLGYEFKSKEYLTVKMPGRKLYHRLDKMDEYFAEERFKYCFEYTSMNIPYFHATNPTWIKRSNMSPYQKQFYGKMYRLRMIEQKRFYVKSAKYAKDLMLFHKLQEEYLFLANNNIRTIEGLLDIRESNLERIDEITKIQDSIYKQNSSKKRACNSDGDWRAYQQWRIDEYSKLDQLKVEKKEAKNMVAMAERCLAEKIDTAMDVISEFEEISSTNKIEIPEFVEERVVETKAEVIRGDSYFEDEQAFTDQKSIERPTVFYEEKPKWDEALQEHQEIVEHIGQSQYKDVPLRVEPLASEENLQSFVLNQVEAKPELVAYTEPLPARFSEYSLLSVEEKVKRYKMTGKEDVYAMVEAYFKRIGHPIYFGEVYDEAQELEKAYKSSLIAEQSELIAVEMLVDGITPESYSLLSVGSKAKYIVFDMTDNNYNLNLYKEVMRKMNQKMSSSELFEGYQEIYEAKMMNRVDTNQEKKWDRSR